MNNQITLWISIAAILISIASFAFAIYQYWKNRKIETSLKISDVLRQSFKLRKSSQLLRNKIDTTDDLDDQDTLLDLIDYFVENNLPKILSKKNISICDIYGLEQELLRLELEFELLVEQINVVIDFNAELFEAGYEPLTTRSTWGRQKAPAP